MSLRSSRALPQPALSTLSCRVRRATSRSACTRPVPGSRAGAQQQPRCRLAASLRLFAEGRALRLCTSTPQRRCLRAAFDPWSVGADTLATDLFAASLFPYLAFLAALGRSETRCPPAVWRGFCFLLVFVAATIPAGLYAKSHYGTSLANVDVLHGTAESLLTVTNLLVVLGLRAALRSPPAAGEETRG